VSGHRGAVDCEPAAPPMRASRAGARVTTT